MLRIKWNFKEKGKVREEKIYNFKSERITGEKNCNCKKKSDNFEIPLRNQTSKKRKWNSKIKNQNSERRKSQLWEKKWQFREDKTRLHESSSIKCLFTLERAGLSTILFWTPGSSRCLSISSSCSRVLKGRSMSTDSTSSSSWPVWPRRWAWRSLSTAHCLCCSSLISISRAMIFCWAAVSVGGASVWTSKKSDIIWVWKHF